MLLLLVQGKLTNRTVEECLAFNSLLENVHKKHCHPKACGRSSIRCLKLPKETQPYKTGYNKDKKNRLMRIDELNNFSDGTLNDVRTALNDRFKGIRIQYLPQTIWRQSDKDKAGAMIQLIDKQLKTRRIMQSLEKFVCGRPYEGSIDFLTPLVDIEKEAVSFRLRPLKLKCTNECILRVIRIILVIFPKHSSDIYKALVDAYESDKLILDTYGDTISFKRRRDDEDKDEEPSAGSNRGSKRRRAGKEPESTCVPKEKISRTTGKSTEGSKYHYKSAGESA
ncbi:hypothetical protein Tco_0848499 [Tanacetum coccineum]